jgi:hypothetical protein
MTPLGMAGSVMVGGHPTPQYDAPVVNISDPAPASGVAGTVVVDWTITYTGTVTSADISSGSTTTNNIGKVWHSSTTSGAAQGTWSLINPTATDGTAKVRFTSTNGSGGFVRVLMLADAAYNSTAGSAQTEWNTPNASVSATPPIVTIGSPSPSSAEEGSAVINWGITYSSWADTYSLITSEITANFTGSTAGTWSVINGTTATPTVRFTSTSGFGTVGFDVLSGACQSGGVNNAPSSASATATITEDGGK